MSSVRQTSTLALVSLIFGLLGWFVLPFIGSLVAIFTGHMGRAEIRRDPARYDGDGLALAGLILGWLNVALWLAGVMALFLFFGGLAWFAHVAS
ncbi:MAG TPA: DUF4190 domain-containing protein [Stenotrophomonas sp.]|jgi:hypothetical protein